MQTPIVLNTIDIFEKTRRKPFPVYFVGAILGQTADQKNKKGMNFLVEYKVEVQSTIIELLFFSIRDKNLGPHPSYC